MPWRNSLISDSFSSLYWNSHVGVEDMDGNTSLSTDEVGNSRLVIQDWQDGGAEYRHESLTMI